MCSGRQVSGGEGRSPGLSLPPGVSSVLPSISSAPVPGKGWHAVGLPQFWPLPLWPVVCPLLPAPPCSLSFPASDRLKNSSGDTQVFAEISKSQLDSPCAQPAVPLILKLIPSSAFLCTGPLGPCPLPRPLCPLCVFGEAPFSVEASVPCSCRKAGQSPHVASGTQKVPRRPRAIPGMSPPLPPKENLSKL